MAFAGMDVGTSGCKMLVYDHSGNVIFQVSRRYRETGSGGWRELDPVTVLEKVKEVLREVGDNCQETIEAMAVASLGESVICLDENGKVLAKSALTGDSRGKQETGRLIREKGAQHIFDITGLPPNELYGLPKYMWMNEHTEAIKRAKAIFFYEDYVGYMLTGRRVVSYSSAARSMAFDIHKKEWSEELLGMAGIRKEQLSVPVPSCTVIGTVLPQIAEQLHLNPEMTVVVGGHDQSCAAFGSGLINMETGECGMGTCEFMFTMLPGVMTTPEMMKNNFTCIPYILPNTYLSSIEVTTCGILKNWARDTLFKSFAEQCERDGHNFFEVMDKRSVQVDTQVLVLPQFGSSGNPDMSMDAYGTITGLTTETGLEEIYRAILEGMAFQMYLSYERMRELGTNMNTIAMTGGGAASELALQIRADVFNMRVTSLQNYESGALGCMMMAGIGAGVFESPVDAIYRAVRTKKVYEPDEKRHAAYMKKYARYKKLYEKMYDFR